MLNILIKWILNAVTLIVIAYIVPGFHISSFYTALILVILLGIINITIKPVLLILTLPINILTLGLFTFIINGLLLLFLSSIIKGFNIDGIWPAILASILISILNFFMHQIKNHSEK